MLTGLFLNILKFVQLNAQVRSGLHITGLFPCQMRLLVKGNDFRVFRNALVEAAKNVLFAV